jgi:hypothetical protein
MSLNFSPISEQKFVRITSRSKSLLQNCLILLEQKNMLTITISSRTTLIAELTNKLHLSKVIG